MKKIPIKNKNKKEKKKKRKKERKRKRKKKKKKKETIKFNNIMVKLNSKQWGKGRVKS